MLQGEFSFVSTFCGAHGDGVDDADASESSHHRRVVLSGQLCFGSRRIDIRDSDQYRSSVPQRRDHPRYLRHHPPPCTARQWDQPGVRCHGQSHPPRCAHQHDIAEHHHHRCVLRCLSHRFERIQHGQRRDHLAARYSLRQCGGRRALSHRRVANSGAFSVPHSGPFRQSYHGRETRR